MIDYAFMAIEPLAAWGFPIAFGLVATVALAVAWYADHAGW